MTVRRLSLYLCFLLSGAAALTYEVVWQRMFTLVLGVTSLSIAAVLTAFMVGLALGPRLFGRLADRVERPNRLYAAVEIGIAATGIALTFSLDPLMKLYIQLAGWVGNESDALHWIRFGISLLALIVPSTLIGATAPLMGRMVFNWSANLGSAFGRFYAVNTLGAMIGAGAAGFWLIRSIGMQSAVFVAAGCNLLAAILSMVVGSELPHPQQLTDPPPFKREQGESVPNRGASERLILILAAVTGLTGLGYEVAWSRLIAVYTLNSIYVFTMMLTVFLGGIALGSAASTWIMRRPKYPPLAYVGIIQFLLALTCPLVLGLTRYGAEWGYDLQWRDPRGVFLVEYKFVAMIVLAPSLLLGMTLPLLAASLREAGQHPGRSVGAIYSANTIGTIIGAAATGLALIPLLGIRATMMVFGLTNFIVGCVALLRCGVLTDQARSKGIALAAIAMVALSLLTPYETRFIRPMTAQDDAVLYYEEGRNAIVHVTLRKLPEGDQEILYVDSLSVAGTSKALITDQKMLAHLPLLLHPAPKRALTVGFGTGGTSYSMLLHEVQTHCVEIEPKVAAASTLFYNQNAGVVGLQEGRSGRTDYHLILDDARSWLNLADQPYDVIVDDLTSLQYRGNGNLYTRECFELIRDRLSPDGVGCAWVPITGVDRQPLQMVIRTFADVFEHTSVWYMNNVVNDFVILVGTPQPLSIDMKAWQWRFAEPMIGDDLAVVGLNEPYHLAASLLLTGDEVACFTGEGPLHTDDQPLLDYLTHAGTYHDTLADNLRAMLACSPEQRLDEIVQNTDDAEWSRWQEAARDAVIGHAYAREGDTAAAQAAYQRAAERVPEYAGFTRLAWGDDR